MGLLIGATFAGCIVHAKGWLVRVLCNKTCMIFNPKTKNILTPFDLQMMDVVTDLEQIMVLWTEHLLATKQLLWMKVLCMT